MTLSETGRLVLGRQFQQPDRRSCGAAVAVVAEALRNDTYARRLLAGGDDEFDREVRAMHRRITGLVDVSGALQLPWPRPLGTPPAALARQLDRGRRRRVVVSARTRPGVAWALVAAALLRGDLVPAYVGSRWLPRHVVLVVEAGEEVLRAYDPATGRVLRITHSEWLQGRLRVAGWRVPWLVIVPRERHSPA
ncbi:hypothetical protein [Nocardioides piscis]|uniref:Peptidase C39 domain-containing protein n=1 Tax=Nocardioides piscis TaxID=2714938 RepID=A0A6G7YFD7_9ACTN|nr:hypothetical protein [Nocardioides piscis]QIK75532.1 hypothetical protein G7071_08865 [Nocardioides piscis]